MKKRLLIILAISILFHGKSNAQSYVQNIKFLLSNKEVSLNSSFEETVSFEYGDNHNDNLRYGKLPIADECKGSEIRYYWVYLKDSKLAEHIYSFFQSKGLSDKITKDSYIVYFYSDDKLKRISLRIFTEPKYMKQFYGAIGQDVSKYKEFYSEKKGNKHYVSGNSIDLKSVEIMLMNNEGYEMCIGDWWHK